MEDKNYQGLYEPTENVSEKSQSGEIRVVVDTKISKESADALAKELAEKGHDDVMVMSTGWAHRVISRYETKAKADKAMKELEKAGYTPVFFNP